MPSVAYIVSSFGAQIDTVPRACAPG